MGRSTGAQGSKYGKKCKLCRKCDSLQSKECNQYCVWMSGSKECQVCHKEPDCKPCDPWNQHCKSEEPEFNLGESGLFGTKGKDSDAKKHSKKSDNESGEGSTEQNSESSEYYDDSYEEVSSEKSKDKPEKGHVSH